MKKLAIIFFSITILTSWVKSDYDSSERANAKIKTIYIYNFTKYIEWPKSYKEGKFVIGILGNNPSLYDELYQMAQSKTVGTQKIEIKNITSIELVTECHIIYILSSNSEQLKDVLQTLKGKSSLIITDKPGMAKQGAAINFVVSENKQKIELNKTNIEKYKLKVASTLENMAIPVN